MSSERVNTANSETGAWPVVFREVLELGNPLSNIAICSLWTHRRAVSRWFQKSEYCVIGNLYSMSGISPIIRNVYANPYIRYIVIWGNDLSGTGDALVEFMRDGINSDHRTGQSGIEIEGEIDKEAIDKLRAHVSLLDLRGTSQEKFKEVVRGLPPLAPFSEPRHFPVSGNSQTVKLEERTSESTGFRVTEKTIAATWLHVLYTVMQFGRGKYSRYGNDNKLREILNLVAVITEEQLTDGEYLPDYLPVTKEQLRLYYPQILQPQVIEGTEYSYGDRLHNYNGIDQIEIMIDRLRNTPTSKRIYATTWKVEVDAIDRGGDAPCLTQINGAVQNDVFFLTAHFRSQDMFGAWPRNAFAMRKLQAEIASAADIGVGPLTIITHSAHIYSWDWSRARDLLKEYERIRHPAAEMDHRGYVIVNIVNDKIEAKLYSTENKLLDRVIGTSARKLGIEIARRMWTADAGHALYLGTELMKAEIALHTSSPYIQDASLTPRLLRRDNNNGNQEDQ
jgi:thymidylate synthase